MTNIQLSIIIPVYNVEKYLARCLDSVLDQDISNYEIIIVNDGSPDNCQKIIEEYQNKYPALIKSYLKKNGGISSARNFGVDKASGKYICFIDSDDYVEKNHYKKMLELAIKEDSDLVVTDFEYVWESKKYDNLYKNGIEYVNKDLRKCMFLSPLFSWNKMYKRELFNKLNCHYPEGLWYEDIPVTLLYSASSNKISHLKEKGFNYVQRSSSIMSSSYTPKMKDIFIEFENIYNNFNKNNLFEQYKDELEYLFVEHFLVYGAFRFLRTGHYKELMSDAFVFVKKYFPNYRKNKYLYTLGKKNNLFLKTNNKLTMSFWHWYLTRGKYEG